MNQDGGLSPGRQRRSRDKKTSQGLQTTVPAHKASTTSQKGDYHRLSVYQPADGPARRKSQMHRYSVAGGPWQAQFSDRTSTSMQSSDLYNQRPVQYEPTYKMEPDSHFSTAKVEGIIRSVLQTHLKDVRYHGPEMGLRAKDLADIIKDRVKSLKMDRFKVVSWVTIVERKDNSIRVASRGLWDAQVDGYVTATFENQTLNAIGIVYAIYQE